MEASLAGILAFNTSPPLHFCSSSATKYVIMFSTLVYSTYKQVPCPVIIPHHLYHQGSPPFKRATFETPPHYHSVSRHIVSSDAKVMFFMITETIWFMTLAESPLSPIIQKLLPGGVTTGARGLLNPILCYSYWTIFASNRWDHMWKLKYTTQDSYHPSPIQQGIGFEKLVWLFFFFAFTKISTKSFKAW